MSDTEETDPTSWPGWATERVVVVDHDPGWATQGSRERRLLQSLMAPWLTGEVEHIGSTAVPGLAAKPILDLQAPVADLAVAGAIAPVLARHRWHAVPPELDQRPDRRFFVKVADDRRVAHLHLLIAGDGRWQRQPAFRDALRADPSLVQAYAELKAQLARVHPDDRETYTTGKESFVNAVLSGTARG